MTMEHEAIYEHTDIPAGMTCAQYRRRRAAEQRHRRLARLLGLLHRR
jgi:heme A synthase